MIHPHKNKQMKFLLNYFCKGQLAKLFFCFADPHFQTYIDRKGMINKYLLNDYSYILKNGGKLYPITDIEEPHNRQKVLKQNQCFREINLE